MAIIASGTEYSAGQFISDAMRKRMQETEESTLSPRAGTLAEGKSVTDAMRESSGLEAPASGMDTVSISEEGRAKQQNMASGEDGQASDGQTVAGGKAQFSQKAEEADEQSVAEKAKEAIRKQIRQVKEKIADAEARLAQTQGSAGGNTSGGDAEEADMEAAMMGAVGSAVEAESIQAEIKMLNQQLQTLYQQLMQDSEGGGGGAGVSGMPRAGIAGESDGPSGQGQRIEVSA